MSTQLPPSPRPPRRSGANTGMVLIVAAVVIAVVVGIAAIGLLVGNSSATTGVIQRDVPTPTITESPAGRSISQPTNRPPPPTAPSTPANLPPLHCSKPPALPVKPQQFAKAPSPSLAESATWRATIRTNCGTIVMDLNGKAAPQTVSSFIFLSQKHFYDDVPCHRLVPTGIYVLQCGDPTGSGSGGPGYGYGIENAPPNGDYPTGTVAMARTTDPNSNGSQFFIVYADTTLPTDGGGYSIFGKVVKGLDIVQAVAARGLASDQTAPKQPVSILSVALTKL
jgi:peptidyl-prolyl cis-trans isomerase B (cyclophilin B)